MAGDVKCVARSGLLGALAVMLAGLTVMSPALAMPDPTEPPAELRQLEGAAAPVASVGPVLQAIIKSADRPAVAVINGQPMRLGEWVGAAKLTRIGVDDAVLSGPEGKTTLRLLGGIQKHGVAKPAAAHASRANRRQKPETRRN